MQKIIFRGVAVISIFFMMRVPAALAQAPSIVPAPMNTAYIPRGFDDNDKVQITFEGMFNDSCSKVGPHRVQVIDGVVKVQQFAYRYATGCLDVLVPFTQTIDIGIVPAGRYNVIDASTGRVMGILPVAKAKSSGADDFLYAPVSNAMVVNTAGTTSIVALSGTFTDDCFVIKDFKARVHGNLIEVLPIVAHPAQKCAPVRKPWRKDIGFNKPAAGRYLLHVRSLDGQSINHVEDIY